MSSVRCPMCGKENPAELEVCQFCQARLKPLLASSSPEETHKADQPEKSEADLPEWLKSLRPSEGFKEQFGDEEGLPDWLETEESTGESIPTGEPSASDWLAGLRPAQTLDQEQPFEEEGSGDSPAMIEEEEASLPDWLKELSIRQSERLEDSSPAAPFEPPQEEADWLSQLEQVQTPLERESAASPEAAEELVTPLAPEGKEESELPDWLGETAPPPLEEQAKEELPAWLDQLRGPPSGQVDEGGEIPDWLTSLAEESQPPEALPVQPQDKGQPASTPPEEPSESTPEWLEQMAGVIQEAPEGSSGSEVPDWLAEFRTPSSLEESFLSAEETSTPEFSLDWLDEQMEEQQPPANEPPFSELQEEVPPPLVLEPEDQALLEVAPEWLGTGEIEHEIGEVAEPQPAEEEEGLSKAEIPIWLESMRPLEAVAPELPALDANERQIEGSGPLVGLKGVLPGDYGFGKGKVLPPYTVKMHISEAQRAHAALIEELIKTEGEVQPASARPVAKPQQLLFIAIFLVLVAALLWPIYSASQSVSLPIVAPEVLDVSTLVNGLSPNAPVLVAVDYEPALTGEMEAAAGPLVDHLMLKGAYLTLVSTLPTGPAQGERLVRNVSAMGEHNYQQADQYVNLGFIPGGAAGLRGFANSPQRILPFATDGSQAWQTPRLNSIQRISDFNLIVVLTENPYTARLWVEQVQPLLTSTPLVMVVSAQAEAAMRPYYQAQPKQVQGLVAGLAGGAEYENMLGRANLGRTYWDAYSFGISVIVGMLLIGSVANLVAVYMRKEHSATAKVSA